MLQLIRARCIVVAVVSACVVMSVAGQVRAEGTDDNSDTTTNSTTSTTSIPTDVAPEVPRKSGDGRRIVYSNKLQRVWVVNADNDVVRTFLVSGRRGVPKPGSYRVFSQSVSSFSRELPGVTFRFMTRFAIGPRGGNIGFHELPVRNGKPLQTVNQLGTFLGSGCLRSATADARFIFEWARIGTPVVVVP